MSETIVMTEPNQINQDTINDCLDTVKEECGGHFMMVSFRHVKMLKGDGTAAIMLAYYLNEFRTIASRSSESKTLSQNNLWFESMAISAHVDLGMSKDKIRRATEVLVDCGVISTQRRHGNAQWVRINHDKFDGLRPRERESQKAGNPTSGSRETQLPEVEKPNFSTIVENKIKKREESRPPSADRSPSLVPDDAGSRRGELLPQASSNTNQDLALAEKLREAHRRHNRQLGICAKNSAEGFRLLRTIDKKDAAVVVDAYCSDCSRDFQTKHNIPHLSGGHRLRKCWEWVVDGLIRAGKLRTGPGGVLLSGSAPVSETAQKIINRLTQEYTWPQDTQLQLPAVVQQSLERYKHFRSRFRQVRDGTEDEKLRAFAQEVSQHLDRPEQFVFDWFEAIHQKYSDWSEWSGKLAPFDEEHQRFQKMGAGWASDYCGDARRWTKLMKRVKEASL